MSEMECHHYRGPSSTLETVYVSPCGDAPEWDGHTPSDAIHRLMHDMLPEQEVGGEAIE